MNFFSKIKCKIKENLFSIFQIALIVLLVILLVVFVGVIFSKNVEQYISGLIGLTAKNKILTFLGIGMGGILVALQALMSYKRAKAMEDTAKAQADAAQAQARANEHTEQGLRQERLKNAIKHLGDERDSVRLGGAYELFHLAEDSKELRQTALDILCAHIRRTTSETIYRVAHRSKPSEEVQSLLTLLFVKEYKVFKSCDINLQGSWLNGADLMEARLEKAILTRVNLQGATLVEARLKGAILTRGYLQKADLSEVRLQGASLERAHLQEAILADAHLQCAILRGVHLQEADLRRARLQGAELDDAHLQGVNLTMAYLQGTLLIEAHLQCAVLRGTRLQCSDLRRARLQCAILDEVHLQGADLHGTRLQGVGIGNSHSMSFRNRIRNQIGKESDLSNAIFAGGLSQEDVNDLVEGLSDEKANELREKLESHIDQPIRNELPENSGAITGAYTKEEAEQWIAEYEKAMSEVPEGDN